MVVKQEKVAFEDALRMAGFGKYNLMAFVLCSGIIVGMSFEIFSVSYLVPGSGCELNTSSSQQGMLAGVPLTGIILTSHIWGYLADTQGRRKILAISMTLAFVSGALASLSPNWIALAFLKFCSASAVSGAYALSLTLLSEYTPMEKRSTLMMLTTSVFLCSTGMMAVLSIPILPLKFSYYIPYLDIHFNSWRLLDLIFAFPSALGAIGVFCSYESPKYLLSVGREEEALEVLRGIFMVNSGKDGDLYQVNSVVLDEDSNGHTVGFWASIKAQTLPMIKPPLLKDTLLLSLLMFILYICVNPYMVWLPYIVNASMTSVDNGTVGLTLCEMIRVSRDSSLLRTSLEQPKDCSMNQFGLMVVFVISVVIAVVNLVTSGISHCLGRKQLFFGLQLLGGAAAICINFSTIWVLSAICFMIFLTGSINFGSLASFCVDVFPTYVKAMAVCLTLMVGRGSAVLGINLLKRLLDDNCEAGFYIFGTITIVGGFIGLLLPADKTLRERKYYIENQLASNRNS